MNCLHLIKSLPHYNQIMLWHFYFVTPQATIWFYNQSAVLCLNQDMKLTNLSAASIRQLFIKKTFLFIKIKLNI